MKKITLLIFVGVLFFCQKLESQIYVNPITTGRPISTHYLGDKLSTNWYFQFEIGQTSWNASEVGIGQNADGSTGWIWAPAVWYADGSGSNKRVQRNIGDFQFINTGTWYVVGRAKINSGDAWTYADEGGWTNNTVLTTSTSIGSCPYFTVSALSDPTTQTTTAASNTQIDLSWSKWNSKNVMIVRRLTAAAASDAPVQGSAYTVGSTLGTGTVVYNSGGTTFNDTGLTPGTSYTYIFYSENYSYYSSGATANATTTAVSASSDYFRSKTTGNWNTAGTWESSDNGSSNWITATNVPGSSATAITILNGHNITLDANISVSGLTINSGGTFTASDASPRTLTITKSASGSSTTLANSGTWANGTGGSTVVFTGAPSSGDAVHAVSGTIAFQNLTVNKTGGTSNIGASFGANSSLTGTLEIGSGGYISTNPPTGFYGTGSILKFNQGALATYDVNALDKTWSTTEIPQNITVASGKVRVNDNRTATGSLIISADATLEVSAAKQLTINTALTNNGTLTLKSANGVGTATLETPSSISGSGTYNVEQYLSDITSPSSFRNWYISSPVSAAAATVITGTTNNILYERNESNNTYPTATSFVAGRGYVAKIAAGNSNVYTFTGGNLNNGSVTVPISRTTSITKEGFNLVGNPFPAHLKWLQTTADTYGVMTTIWYRTYNSGYSFQTYNAQGDMGVPLDASGYIPPMQAFWVRKIAAGSGNLTLNSTNAVHRSGNPLRAPAQKSGAPNKILRLEVQSNANVDEALIYFNANAANNFDGFDSPKWFNLNDTIPEIYTVADAEKLVINGLNSIQLDTEIPLGFRTGNTNENHNFKLKATQLQNFGTETELVLIDKGITPTETVLNEGTEYTFNSLAVNSTDRFSLVFRAKGSTTGGCCFGTFENKVRIQKNDNNQLVVNCDNYALKNANLTVYNAAGQKLIEQSITESRTTINLALKTGVYLVKLQSEGKIYNVKVAI